MKQQQDKHKSKYAHLVEAQSPEPQEQIETQDLVVSSSSTSQHNSNLIQTTAAAVTTRPLTHETQSIDEQQQQQMALKTFHGQQNQGDNNCNKVSNPTESGSGSEDSVRTASVSSTSNVTRDAAVSIVVGAAPTSVDSSSVFGDPLRKNSSVSSEMSTSFVSTSGSQQWIPSAQTVTCAPQRGPRKLTTAKKNLTRTISQSMLELDNQSHRLNEFCVSWKNLTFGYKSNPLTSRFKKKSQPVLCDISGSFRSNQLVAIIGPSGCGKTTLLQFLAGNHTGRDKEQLRISGLDEPKVAFIGQDDCLLPGLTARETLVYASRLQNTQPDFDHLHHIEPILNGLGLRDCADRSVGKLSGGQVKRVTIGQELLYPTNLLILDEVTSGLDASTSYSIVKLLKQLVSDYQYPMSIVMSIHQPSAKLFAVFDQVYAMSEGSCLYEGSCQVDQVNSYLQRFGLECPKYHNIADYLIEVASEELDRNSHDKSSSVKYQMILFQKKKSHDDQPVLVTPAFKTITSSAGADESEAALTNTINNHRKILNDDEDQDEDSQMVMLMSNCLYDAIERARSKRERPIYKNFKVHLNRSFLRIKRSYILTYLQLTTYILLGLQLATFYGPNIGSLSGCPRLPLSFLAFVFSDETEVENHSLEMRRIQENVNFLLVAILTATFAALEITVITFPLEAKTIKREWRNGWYQVSSYFMGRTLADLPFQLGFVIAFCTVIYLLTSQVGILSWRFGSFVIIIVMCALIAQTIGFIFGALFMNNLPAAVFTAPLCIFPALLFSGFFSRVSQVPSFYKPMTYISHFRYAFDALLVTLYGYDRCKCEQSALNAYHDSLHNQTGNIKDIFKSLFGVVECTPQSPDENSIEDTTDSLGLIVKHSTSTTMLPKLRLLSTIKPLEDALVESVFAHMTNSSLDLADKTDGDGMDRIVHKFSTRVTSMLNAQSNFGHEMPTQCKKFNSYLMTEFDLHNSDLIFGLFMLFIFVVLSRLLCNIILGFTIATRTK